MKKVKFEDIEGMNIIGGQITSRIEAKDGEASLRTINVLVPRAISNGTVDHDFLGTLNIKTESDQKRITKEGDIVVKFSTPYDACIVTKEDEGMLVPSFCAIINNLPDEIDKFYFLAFLNSELCQQKIRSLVSGNTMALLSSSQLKQIEIPIPPLRKQREIAEIYLKNMEKSKILARIMKLEKELINSKMYEMEK